MTSITRDIQRCINRFEFALLTYASGNDLERFYSILTSLEDLLKNDLVNTFKKYSETGKGK